jgi:asparagine synthase (glutamine-hydrolysing)
MKIRGLQGKWLLKKANESRLSNEILYRKKMGFSVPLAQWLRSSLVERARRVVQGERMSDTGLFNMDALQSMLDEHLKGQRDHAVPLWLMIMFDAFLHQTERSDAAQPLAAA